MFPLRPFSYLAKQRMAQYLAVLMLATACFSGTAHAGESATTPTSAKNRVYQLTFTMTHRGLEPSKPRVRAGWYFITLENGVTTDEVSYVIDGPTKTAVASEKLMKRKPRKTVYVELTPGTYTLRVPADKKWTSTIVVADAKE